MTNYSYINISGIFFLQCLPDGFACNPGLTGCCSGTCVVINGQIEGICQDVDDK